MKPRSLAVAAVLALALGALVPATAAHAAPLSVSGIVSDASGPVPFAPVGYFAPISKKYDSFTADENGEYSFNVPSNVGPYYVTGNISPYGVGSAVSLYSYDTNYSPVFVGAGGNRDYLYQSLSPLTTGTAAVVNVTFDKPGSIAIGSSALKKQSLVLTRLDGSTINYVTASSSGSYEFIGLVPGKYKVTSDLYNTTFSPYTSPTITVQAGKKTSISAVPTAGASIKGVVKVKGKAVSGIDVYAYKGLSSGFATTDKKGAYTIKGLTSGTYNLSFANSGRAASASVVAKVFKPKVVAGKTVTVNAALTAAGEVSGSVKVTKGATWAQVYAVKSGKLVGTGYVETKSKGKFSIKGLPTGSYTLYVQDGADKFYAIKKVSVKGGKKSAVGTLSLKKKTVTLSGTVSPSGNGSVSASSRALYGFGGEIKNGKYTIKGLIPGTYSIYSYLDGREESAVTTVKVAKSTKKNLKAGKVLGKVTGTVSLAGVPVTGNGFATSKLGSASITVDRGVLTASGRTGKYTVDSLSFDALFVSGAPFWAELPSNKKSFTITSGKTTSLGSFELKLGR